MQMAFGLKNISTTFVKLVYKVLAQQIGCNIEAYVDDIIFKSVLAQPHAADLQETFNNLH